MVSFQIFMAIYVIYNIYVFLVVMRDKRRAERNEWRTPEINLLIMGFALGAIGLFIGMRYFRHKTSNLKFTAGVPLLIFWNVFVISLLYYSGRFSS